MESLPGLCCWICTWNSLLDRGTLQQIVCVGYRDSKIMLNILIAHRVSPFNLLSDLGSTFLLLFCFSPSASFIFRFSFFLLANSQLLPANGNPGVCVCMCVLWPEGVYWYASNVSSQAWVRIPSWEAVCLIILLPSVEMHALQCELSSLWNRQTLLPLTSNLYLSEWSGVNASGPGRQHHGMSERPSGSCMDGPLWPLSERERENKKDGVNKAPTEKAKA